MVAHDSFICSCVLEACFVVFKPRPLRLGTIIDLFCEPPCTTPGPEAKSATRFIPQPGLAASESDIIHAASTFCRGAHRIQLIAAFVVVTKGTYAQVSHFWTQKLGSVWW